MSFQSCIASVNEIMVIHHTTRPVKRDGSALVLNHPGPPSYECERDSAAIVWQFNLLIKVTVIDVSSVLHVQYGKNSDIYWQDRPYLHSKILNICPKLNSSNSWNHSLLSTVKPNLVSRNLLLLPALAKTRFSQRGRRRRRRRWRRRRRCRKGKTCLYIPEFCDR